MSVLGLYNLQLSLRILYLNYPTIIRLWVGPIALIPGSNESGEELRAGMSSRAVAEEMWGLLRRLQQNEREVVLTYLELCMMYRFFRCLANCLMVAVAMGVSELSKKQPKLLRHTVYMQKDDLFYEGG